MALSKEEKLQLLHKVLKSKTFSKSPTSITLLRFLVTATIEELEIKETTIGLELFGNQFLKQQSTSRIRVNIYHLRKKLRKYYETEGIQDARKLQIDSGQYYVSFVPNKNVARKNYRKLYRLTAYTCLLFLMAILVLAYTLLHKPSVPIWESFFDNGKDTTVVIGDFFGFMGKTGTGRTGWNRDYEINSLKDFYAFENANPQISDSIFPANYSYLTGMASIATYHLSRLFEKKNKDFSIRFSTKLGYDDIKEHNSVYVGPIKNNNKFIEIFNNGNAHFSINKRRLSYKDRLTDKDTIIDLAVDGLASEYALVSRMKGANDTEQFLFFSDHDIGVIAAIELFCDPERAKVFETQYLENTETFTALFNVTGKERTNLGLELIAIGHTQATD